MIARRQDCWPDLQLVCSLMPNAKLMSQISKMSEILLNQLAVLSLFLMVSELQVMLKVHPQAFSELVKS